MSPGPLTAEQLLTSIWAALRRIEDNLSLPPAPLELPAPVIHVPAPDLADLVNAVTSLNGTGPTAEEIARALADVLTPTPDGVSSQGVDALGEVARALEKLDFRLKGMGTQAYGGGSVSFAPGQLDAFADAVNGGNTESRLDYDGRTDNQPVYVGHAAPGAATATAVWRIEKVTYDDSDRPIRKQSLNGAWDSRAALAW